MRFAYVVFVPLLAAQQIPDAAKLLNQRSSALKNHYSYQYTEEMSGTAMSMTTSVHAVNPDKYRMVSTAGAIDAMTIVTDGHSIWMYMPMFKKYSKMSASANAIDGLAAEFGAGNTKEDPELTANAKVIRSEMLEFDGQPHDCWVIETSAPKSGDMQNLVRTFWIDKTLGIDLQMIATGKTNGMDVRIKTAKTSIKFNEHFPDSLFVFTPPSDAAEVDEVIPGMKTMFSGSEPAPKATPAIAQSAPGTEPKAFVPHLNPVEQHKPVYPDAAGSKNVHGMVNLLVTIDTAGFVVQAEAITGPEPLRQAAVDAVRKWKFHPVIRNGQPVYAYTESTVDFMNHSKSAYSVEDMNINLADDMASVQRMAELQANFPRSPAEVLADLEQDRGASTGVDRSFALPELAKAALAAGTLDKAAAYANEMLQSKTEDPNRGQGIHDGNMVLGMISLQKGDLDGARSYLLESGKSTGSPVLDSFGPNMKLAKELLEKGEKDAVLQYFSSCRTFWKMGATKLDEWSAMVRQGAIPDFGANLAY